MSERDDEIDFGEISKSIVHNWWVVLATLVLGVVMASHYAFNLAVPQFEAQTKFELLEDSGSGSSFGDLSALAAFTGVSLSGGSSEAETLKDRILTKTFIDSIFDVGEFDTDPAFNGYLVEPGFISRVMSSIFGASKRKVPSRDDLIISVIGVLKVRMDVEIGDNGIILLRVQHPDGKRAAFLADLLVESMLDEIFTRNRDEARLELNYFEDELLNVRADLDAASQAVAEYAVENNLQSAELLARASTQIQQVLDDLETAELAISVLDRLSSIGVSDFDGVKFADEFPAAKNLSVRRKLGWSASPSSWQYPGGARIASEIVALTVRKDQLQATLDELQTNARSSSESALELAALERELEVQLAIYETVIKQFEAQALFAGFETASGRVLDEANVPGRPSKPRKLLILAMGMVLGMMSGVLMVFVKSRWTGIIYSRRALKRRFAIDPTWSFERTSFPKAKKLLANGRQAERLQDISFSLGADAKLVGIIGGARDQKILGLGVGLAQHSVSAGDSVAMLCLGKLPGLSEHGHQISDASEIDQLEKQGAMFGIDVYLAKNEIRFLSDNETAATIGKLGDAYDRVFIVSKEIKSGLTPAMLAADVSDRLITVAERARTTSSQVDELQMVMSKHKNSDPILVVA